jgi:hypothetical protein
MIGWGDFGLGGAALCCVLYAVYLFIGALRPGAPSVTGSRTVPADVPPAPPVPDAPRPIRLFRVYYATSEDFVAEVIEAADMGAARSEARRRLKACLIDPLPAGRPEEMAVAVVPFSLSWRPGEVGQSPPHAPAGPRPAWKEITPHLACWAPRDLTGWTVGAARPDA